MADATTQSKGRQRVRTSDSPESDDGKKRGRPRVEKQDESAADRRRTQIRMAQRAYRQRKESTLEDLRKRVSELTNTIELMNRAFTDCRDRLSGSGLSDHQMQDMRETSMQLEALMKPVRNPGDESPPSQSAGAHRPAESAMSQGVPFQLSVQAQPKNVPSWIDEAVFSDRPKQRPNMEVGLGYTMYMQESDGMTTPPMDYFEMDQAQLGNPFGGKPQQPSSFDAFRVDVPEAVQFTQSMPAPKTYSFQETTFARRLHRACLEQGYQLLLDPTRRPATFDRVFRLAMIGRDRNKLILNMKDMLDRGPHESLDLWEAPLIHVGGAGTHFPRRDQYGNWKPKKDAHHLGCVGPQTLALLENAAYNNLTTDMTVEVVGFEGEWFDPYDVEGYIADKGIFIDPSSSFAEAEVLAPTGGAVTSSNASTVSASPGSPETPQQQPQPQPGLFSKSDPPIPFDDEQLKELDRMHVTPGQWNDFSALNLTGIGFSDASTGSWMNFLQPGEAMKMHPSQPMDAPGTVPANWDAPKTSSFLPQPSVPGMAQSPGSMFTKQASARPPSAKKVIIIDVDKFIKLLTVSGICIGRTPGFKRRDVDRALALSSFDAF